MHRKEKSNSKDQILHIKKLQTKWKIKFKVSIRKEMIQINRNVEINKEK